jgi:Spy/CpxP family protein refolding chaperone
MIRKKILFVLPAILLIAVAAQGQQAPQPGERVRERVESPANLLDILNLLSATQQRSGGGRGEAPPANAWPPTTVWLSRTGRTLGGAWWTNSAFVAQLGLTDDQKTRIARVFENHRANLEASRVRLEKEEADLARLLEAEPFDRNAAQAQTYRAIQARSDMERENALMTLEMREHLTRAQWMQLPQPSLDLSYTIRRQPTNPGATGGAGATGGGARGARGQQ